MATPNPFDLLGEDDNDDPSHLIAVQQQRIAAKKSATAAVSPPSAAKLPSKPLPPAQAVRESRSSTSPARGGATRGGTPRGRGARGAGIGLNRDFGGDGNGYTRSYGSGGNGDEGEAGKPIERGERESGAYGGPPRGLFRGGRRGGYGNGEGRGDAERPPARAFERRSGTGRGSEIKREGGGRGNWGTVNDDILAQETEENLVIEEKAAVSEKQPEQEDASPEVNKNTETEEKEREDKEMTLEEYEKVLEERRKALLALKAEERKVEADKDFESMHQLSLKKGNDDIFIKLGSDKEKKKNADREERARKALSINEFLKPAEGERYYGPSGRGRGRGRGRGESGAFRGCFGGGSFGGGGASHAAAPAIEDPGQFPTLGGK